MDETAIITVADTGRAPLIQLAEAARDYALMGRSANTRRAYEGAWRSFTNWCASVGACPLPADAATIALYLTDRAPTLAVPTLAQHIAAVRAAHKAAKLPFPESDALDQVWAGIRRKHGRPPRRKRAMRTAQLKAALKKLPDGLAGSRDKALLLVGFSSALRREELAALSLDAGAVVAAALHDDGLEIVLARSKGDQVGAGQTVAVPRGKPGTCPVEALEDWLRTAQIRSGAIFRQVNRHGRLGPPISGRAAAEIVKRAAVRCGLQAQDFAGHSLRRGFATEVSANGAAPQDVMRQLRHSRLETTMVYVEDAQRFRRSAARKTGL